MPLLYLSLLKIRHGPLPSPTLPLPLSAPAPGPLWPWIAVSLACHIFPSFLNSCAISKGQRAWWALLTRKAGEKERRIPEVSREGRWWMGFPPNFSLCFWLLGTGATWQWPPRYPKNLVKVTFVGWRYWGASEHPYLSLLGRDLAAVRDVSRNGPQGCWFLPRPGWAFLPPRVLSGTASWNIEHPGNHGF